MPLPPPPTLEDTYHTGAALKLYPWATPSRPDDTWCSYETDAPLLTELSDRYSTSIAQQVTLPSTPPNVSITLEQRLLSSTHRVPHVWSAHIQDSSLPAGTTEATYSSQLVAKIFDPVFFDSYDAEYINPFTLRDFSISCEVEAYQRLGFLQGKIVPRFYGHFVAPLPSQDGRTINVLLLEHVQGRDLRVLIPPDAAENVCHRHKDAIIDAALRVYFDILACGVNQTDMQPRNVILRPQKLVSGMQYCATLECPQCLEIDCNNLHMVMDDFERVDLQEPDTSFSEPSMQNVHVENVKSLYLEKWLENML